MIDAIDRKILTILQQDARTPNAEIARQIDLAPSAVHERVRKLQERGVIEGFETRVDPDCLGHTLLAFVNVKTNELANQSVSAHELARIPEVQEIHNIAGEDCYLLKVRTSSPAALGRLLREKVGIVAEVVSTRTTIVMETYKETTAVPIGLDEPEVTEKDQV